MRSKQHFTLIDQRKPHKGYELPEENALGVAFGVLLHLLSLSLHE